jgi:hypothetical protein
VWLKFARFPQIHKSHHNNKDQGIFIFQKTLLVEVVDVEKANGGICGTCLGMGQSCFPLKSTDEKKLEKSE